MDNQQIFNSLSGLEEALYYKMQNPDDLDFSALSAIHDSINNALCKWHNLTGCKNQ